ncbi:hypothetical protein hmeg3_21325 [Herbaspirillum sp. meg3]|uniref:AAC(3) family N-acetyltransferase n=1 Tax=Herbaspirillum sp. meg3 TaxID=2025949 RepID=UPI000B98C4B4|nr:AAC(3) family N-acetyltransferase [Herbaspirillum sp. meg3]ASU40586.1 hypothetical protein hmeg3_21325 [Herbaspirillum sp. meg3]
MSRWLSATDITRAFHEAGVQRGDLLMLHSDSMVLAQLPPMSTDERCNLFFDALDEVLGPDGTLILPTFSYSFTKNENFNVQTTPSTVGMLTNHFRLMPGVLRSEDPNFSVAARGPLAPELTAIKSDDCFGSASFFAWLERQDALLAGMGCAIDRFTFVHYLEQKANVNYRYFKNFSGMVQNGEDMRAQQVSYFVRDVERQTALDLSRLREVMLNKEDLLVVPVGRVALSMTRCSQFMAATMELLLENPSALIVEGNPK